MVEWVVGAEDVKMTAVAWGTRISSDYAVERFVAMAPTGKTDTHYHREGETT